MGVGLTLVWTSKQFEGYCAFQHNNLVFFTRMNSPPATVSLELCWQTEGIYYFLPTDFRDIGSFAKEAATTYTNDLSEGRIIVWVKNPWDTYVVWRKTELLAAGDAAERHVTRYSPFGLGRYGITLSRGCRLDCTGDAFVLSGIADQTLFVCHLAEAVVTPLSTQVEITVGGSKSGILSFAVEAAPGPAGGNLFDSLDSGLRYSSHLAKEGSVHDRALNGHIGTINNTLFTYIGSLRFACFLDPLALYDPARTAFLIEEKTEVKSNLVNWVGEPINLIAGQGAGLALGRAAAYGYKSGSEDGVSTNPYLCPTGEYRILASENPGADRLLCGLGGTEFMRLGEDARLLSFSAGNDSFLEDGKLAGHTSTSYISFAAGTEYISQPKAAPFFAASQGVDSLDFLPTPWLRLKKKGPAVPFMPYHAAKVNDSRMVSISQMEETIYSVRKTMLEEHDIPVADSNASCVAITPQGLMVEIDGSGAMPGNWKWLALANTLKNVAQVPNMRFTDLATELRGEFQNVDLFILFNDKDVILSKAGVADNFDFGVDGWAFRMNPKLWRGVEWGNSRTAMLVKFSNTQSVRTWMGDDPVFSLSLRDAYDEEGRPRDAYTEFLSVIDDPFFQGIIFVNCPVEVDKNDPGYINEISPVLDTIDMGQLCAHHVIVYRSQVAIEDGNICMARANLSALIDYKQDARITYDPNKESKEYEFSTLEFALSIKEGKVSKVSSVSELLINRLFSSPAKKQNSSSGNSLVIVGALQETNGKKEFAYNLRESSMFNLTGCAVEEVLIETVALAVGEMTYTFHLSGRLYFIMSDRADLFSYGTEPNGNIFEVDEEALQEEHKQTGLKFDGLVLASAENEAIKIVYDGMTVLASASTPRAIGFAACYPAVPARFAYSLTSEVPEDYMAISAPIEQGELKAPWFGLDYEISLGALGALSSDSGLKIRLLVAWSPGESSPALYAGVRVPGLSDLKLQGVFQIGFSSIELKANLEGMAANYTLIMNQMAIRVLGLSFPKGENKLYFFAQPGDSRLGWYAAYKESDAGQGYLPEGSS